jgi:hypothetical protein
LATRLVRLDSDLGESSAMPAKGEALKLGEVEALSNDPRVRKALRRLVEEDVPQSIGQLALSRLGGLDWDAIDERARGWANLDELALARRFVEQLDREPTGGKPEKRGALYWDVAARDDARIPAADALLATLRSRPVLGLDPSKKAVPDSPQGPSLAVRVTLGGRSEKAGVHVSINAASARSGRWESAGKFTLPEKNGAGEPNLDYLTDSIAGGILGQLVRVELIKGGSANGTKVSDRLRIVNSSPLILHGLMVAGSSPDLDDSPALRALALAPRRSLTVTVTPKAVQKLGLRTGLHATAANFDAF